MTEIQKLETQDLWATGLRGKLFVRVWSPLGHHDRLPIILLHDSLGSVELWRGFPEALSKATGRQVIAYDRTGFGQSDEFKGRLASDFVTTEATGDFAAIKQHLHIDRFIIFGHSVGGGMAVNCAAYFSNACAALITESAQAFVEDRTIQGIEQAKELFKDPLQVSRLGKYHGNKAQWVLDAWIETWLDPEFATWSLKSVIPLVKCPALFIHGSDDEYGSTQHPELLASLTGGSSRLAIMPQTRHVPHRERESDVIQVIKDFVLRLD